MFFHRGFFILEVFITKKSKTLNDKSFTTKKIAILGAVTALAYISTMLTSPIKVFEFLSCDIKDAIIVIASLIFGPLSGFIVTVLVSVLEFFTISQTGVIGMVMNILSTAFFIVPASLIYKYKKTLTSAVIGLLVGTVFMTIAMLLWNYLFTPLYMGIPREAVVSMLPTVFLPFNVIKGGINTTLALILYKPLVTVMRKTHLIPTKETSDNKLNKGRYVLVLVVSLILLAVCVLLLLFLGGVI